MGKFKSAMKTMGKVADVMLERKEKVDAMHREILRHAYGVDPIEARKVASALVDHADVTWK